MNIIFNQYRNKTQFPSQKSFQGKTSNIPTERILELLNSGMSVKAIKSELGIALDTFYKLLRERGIEYKKQELSPKLQNISKVQLESFHITNTPVAEICKQLKITANGYYKLLEHHGIKTPNQKLLEHRAQITKKQLQECVNSYKSVTERCEKLGINENTYYRLVQEMDILTEYKKRIARNKEISANDILVLQNEGKTLNEILEILGISSNAYNNLLLKNDIITKGKAAKQKISEISKEQLLNLINLGKKVSEICNELGIKERTYSRLLDKFNITTARKKSKEIARSITKEQLQYLVNQKLSPSEICNELNISKDSFYKLLKLRKINYDYLHHAKEIVIPKHTIQEAAKSGKSVKEISEKLNIAQNTFGFKAKVAGVKTHYRDNIDKIMSISKEQIQDAINNRLSVKEICEKLNITKANYTALLRKFNLATIQREASTRIAQITPSQIKEKLKEGKKVNEICKELKISQSTYYRIIKQDYK